MRIKSPITFLSLINGLPRGDLAFGFADPETGEQRGVFDLGRPQGIQEELSQPAPVLLNDGSEVIALASGAGYRCFTSVDTFKSCVKQEILIGELVA